MIFWLFVGVVLGYFFKPQLDKLVYKTVRLIKDRQNGRKYRGDGDTY
ncbi:MAG: hypothetical protein JW852_05945 [Spirochaetales bacterium]|nr:hypothetical protein [Spirochaetales bacterium]